MLQGYILLSYCGYYPGWTLRWITLLTSNNPHQTTVHENLYICWDTPRAHSCWLEHVVAEQGGLCQLAPLFSVIGRFDIWCCRKQPDFLQEPLSLLPNKDGHLIILWWNILWCSEVSLIETYFLTHYLNVRSLCTVIQSLLFVLFKKRWRGSVSVRRTSHDKSICHFFCVWQFLAPGRCIGHHFHNNN